MTKTFSTLTPDEQRLIRETFREFSGNSPTKNGVGVFLRLLQECDRLCGCCERNFHTVSLIISPHDHPDPQYKKLWPTFNSVHDMHMMDAVEMKAFAATFMSAVGGCV